MSLEEDITTYLQSHAGAKAKDIAANLRLEKGDVNRALYQGRGRTFEVDDTFRWSLLGARSASPQSPSEFLSSITGEYDASREAILKARLTLARLKRGVPPADGIDMLAVGMERLDRRLDALLGASPSSRWFAVTGEYGEGKSFFRAFACQKALSAGYAVASLDINKDEGALHQPQRHLAVVFRSLRSPLDALRSHQGITDLFRQWVAATPNQTVVEVLQQLLSVEPWSPAGRDPIHFRNLVESALKTTEVLSRNGSYNSDQNSTSSVTLVDSNGFSYKRTLLTGEVYRQAPGASVWHWFGRPESWDNVISLCRTYATGVDTKAESIAPRSFAALMSFLAFEDLVFKGTYARFQAQYRFQLIVEWLKLIGHKGLFLFVDELDNVVRQIHGKAHPGCFRTLAWYCASEAILPVRVVFATTPEVMTLLDDGCREAYMQTLNSQYSVRPEEFGVYCDWNNQADAHASRGWDHCVTLQPEQRIELFHRIRVLHDLAWGPGKLPPTSTLERLAVLPSFDTTRRWVRATVKLLDLVKQNRC